MDNKEVFARCKDDCLFPVYTKEQTDEAMQQLKNDLYSKEELTEWFDGINESISETDNNVKALQTFDIDVVQALTEDGTSVYSVSKTAAEIASIKGTPRVVYWFTASDVSTRVCYASLYTVEDGVYKFASVPDNNGTSYAFFITNSGVEVYENIKETPCPFIAEEYAEMPASVGGVMMYAQPKIFVISGNLTETGLTVDSDLFLIEQAITDGAELVLEFASYVKAGRMHRLQLAGISNEYLHFSGIGFVLAADELTGTVDGVSVLIKRDETLWSRITLIEI